MRKLAAATLAIPVLGFVYFTSFVRRSIPAQLAALGLVVALVAGGLLIGLPAKSVSANPAPTYAPKPPTAQANIVSDLGLTSAFSIEFSKPMDKASVAASIALVPYVNYHLVWDATGQNVSLLPDGHWAPGTYYTVDVAATALDRDGLKLGEPTGASFLTVAGTSGTITATTVLGKFVAPTTSFVVTFSGPVKLATVQSAFNITPLVSGTLVGDDDSDAASQVFTFTPDEPLAMGSSYVVSFSAAVMYDAAGAPLASIAPLTTSTQTVPAVVRFGPRDGTTGVDPAQVISVRFTTKMDEAATGPAFTATANGKPVTGKLTWSENDTVLAITPSAKLPASAKVVATVSTDAMSSSGLHTEAPASATFTVAKPAAPKAPSTTSTTKAPSTTTKVPSTGGSAVGTAQWHAAEVYFLQLTNCTRTGGWVLAGGLCRSSGPHTLPAARALVMDDGISAKVSRPYAEFMAERGILSHYANGNPGQRLARAGYTSYHWGENIGSPSSVMAGMVDDAIYFQNEAPYKGGHYVNLMNSAFDRAGVGVWVSSGRVRVVIDFYHP